MNFTNNYYTGWWGGSGGSSFSWENVEEFYNRTMDMDLNVPLGILDVASKAISSLTSTNIRSLYDADIVQFAKIIPNEGFMYFHSAFVDYNNMPGSLTGVYVSAHTSDRHFSKITDVIAGNSATDLRSFGFQFALTNF